MIRVAFCILAFAPLAVSAQPSDLLLGTSPAPFFGVADEGDEDPNSDECLGSGEDQAACYVVAGIATAAFGAAAIVGLVREGNPCAYIGWGDCGECKDPDRADTAADDAPAPRRGVGIIPSLR